MTGNDRLSARFLHHEFFEFVPTFKIFLSTNHRPTIRGTDHAIWRRIRLIPFEVVIPDEKQDKTLPRKLRAERSGILNWLIQGALEWKKEGLGKPDEVVKATKEYRGEQDILGKFLEECTEKKAGESVQSTRLYELYQW